MAHRAALISVSCSPQPDTSRSCKTMDTGLVHRVVCPFTPQLSLVLINRPRRDGTLSWRWYAAATGRSRTRDLQIAKSGTIPLGHRVPMVFKDTTHKTFFQIPCKNCHFDLVYLSLIVAMHIVKIIGYIWVNITVKTVWVTSPNSSFGSALV